MGINDDEKEARNSSEDALFFCWECTSWDIEIREDCDNYIIRLKALLKSTSPHTTDVRSF